MITAKSLLQENYEHVNIWNTDLYINEDGTVYRANIKTKNIKLCSNNKPNSEGYKQIHLTNNQGKRKMFQLYRLVFYAFNPDWNIFDTSTDNSIDHKNRIKTDDRLCNLRNVKHQHNGFNRKCKGYYYHKQAKKYQAQIYLNGKRIHLGSYLEAKPKYHVIIEL
jgi:hypothetical protein